ncbi:MAG: type II secretion system protein [Verrucomicrobia bacterium]|nr:type II secretion system protein [Verrucomicrobiota bacterium]
MKTTSNSGFSLIELMVVVLIIAVLAGMVIGGIGYMQNKAIDARCAAQFARVCAAIEEYKADHGYYPITYKGNSTAPDISDLPAYLAWRSDNLKTNGAATLYRSLVYIGSGAPANDFGKEYLRNGRDVGLSGVSKFMVNDSGKIVQGSKAGSQNGAQRISNPNGSVYGYRAPGYYNKGGFDLWVGSTLGKAYYNWKQ